MRVINAFAINRKGQGVCNQTFQFDTFFNLDNQINNWLNDEDFPFYKVILELTPEGWKPSEEEQETLNKIEEGRFADYQYCFLKE